MQKQTLLATSALWLVFLVALSAAKSLGHGRIIWGTIEAFLGGHRQMHFAMALVLSALWHLAVYHPKGQFNNNLRLFNPVLLVLVLGCIVDEGVQFYFPARHFNPLDAVTSIGGLAAGFGIAWLYQSLTRSSAPSHY